MELLILSILLIFLNVSHQSPLGQWTMLPHVLVVEVDGTLSHLPLSCLASSEDVQREKYVREDIIWMKDGEKEAQTGNSYVVELEESLGGGNYTCHSRDGSLLNHTVVLIHEDETKRRKILEKNDQEQYLSCSTQNFNGHFRCFWSWHSSRVGKVAFIKVWRVSDDSIIQCSVDSSGNNWVCTSGQRSFFCSVGDSGREILCVDKEHCPYAEESQQIHVTVYVTTESFLVENYSTHFFLSEIVKPDKVQISKFNATMIEWSYPSSWSSPFSYFPLTFQIALLKRQCKECENPCNDLRAAKPLTVDSPRTCQFQVKRKTKSVCIRAKDALCNSQWSEWSHFRLKKGRKDKNKQNKKKQK